MAGKMSLANNSLFYGGDHTLQIIDGKLFSCGGNSHGQLGLGDTCKRGTPTLVGVFSDWSSVAAGEGHSRAF